MDLRQPVTQQQFGELVGIAQANVSELVRRNVLREGSTLHEWLLAYCGRLREEAAGRSLELTQERTRLDRARADHQEMVNAHKRGELVHVGVMRRVFAAVGRRASGVLEGLPARLRREVGELDGRAMELIEGEIVRARNEIGALQLSLEEIEDGSVGTEQSTVGA